MMYNDSSDNAVNGPTTMMGEYHVTSHNKHLFVEGIGVCFKKTELRLPRVGFNEFKKK